VTGPAHGIWLAASFSLARRRIREAHMFANELQISNVFVAPVACFELNKRRQANKQRVVDALRRPLVRRQSPPQLIPEPEPRHSMLYE
jgi:hypothetical protein